MTAAPASPIRTALAAVGTGAAAGGIALSLFLYAVWDMARGESTPRADVILLGGAAGLATAVLVTWLRARGLNPWHRAMAAAVGMAGAMVAGVLTTVADMAWPRNGLLVLAAACAAVGALAWRAGRSAS